MFKLAPQPSAEDQVNANFLLEIQLRLFSQTRTIILKGRMSLLTQLNCQFFLLQK